MGWWGNCALRQRAASVPRTDKPTVKYLPLHHNFTGRRCLVIGGGAVAAKRVRRILDAGGRVDVIATEVGDDLAELADLIAAGGGEVALRPWASGDLGEREHYALVVAATDDHEVNRRVAAEAGDKGIPVNVVNDAALCDVVFPLTIDRDPLTITIASGAASPTLTRLLGNRINSLIPDGYGELARLVGRFRKRAQAKIPDTAARIRFWENILQGVVAESVFSGKMAEASRLLDQALDSAATSAGAVAETGEVYLIGAGPGDPDLLTLRAFRLLLQADVVLYDRLVSPEILARLDPGAEQIYVGKQRAEHSVPQRSINQMLVDYARLGKRVARLKGGDPFIFGRGGEEIAQLAGEGIPFQVIPGITAAAGCASYAGIPLTHRDHAQSVRFVTGQLQDGSVNLDWQSLVAPGQTLVFYMSLNGLPIICENLLAFGLQANLPVALIEKGTTQQQKVYVSTLGEMRGVLDDNEIHAPTIFIVGSVVSLHHSLNWFGAK